MTREEIFTDINEICQRCQPEFFHYPCPTLIYIDLVYCIQIDSNLILDTTHIPLANESKRNYSFFTKCFE